MSVSIHWRLAFLTFSAGWALACAGGGGGDEDSKPGLFEDHDVDDDGYTYDEDCNDEDAAIHPDATELCDPGDVDEDCDGYADNADPDLADGIDVWHDADGDGFGNLAEGITQCESSAAYVTDSTDCDDADATISPAAQEVCDGATDEDCDGLVDDADDSLSDAGRMDVWPDADGDGYGDEDAASERACTPGAEQSDGAGDCDDGDAATNPGALEVCGGGDENCDGVVDEDSASDAPLWYADDDGDGYGDPDASTASCAAPARFVADDTDCDDTDEGVSPVAVEVCDGVDDDCDGDADDDSAIDVRTWYRDADGDGYGDASDTDVDCDQPSGYVAGATDCDDTSAGVSPADTEICDRSDTDEDCDGLADDDDTSTASGGKTNYYVDADGDGYGAGSVVRRCDSASGYATSSTDCDDARSTINPAATEVCDSGNTDEDCDSHADDADSSVSAASRSTWYVDADADGYGTATSTRTQCDAPSGYAAVSSDCDDAAASINPGEDEVCDSADVDEDCDGGADDADPDMPSTDKTAWSVDGDGDDWGAGGVAIYRCATPSGYAVDGDCDDTDVTVYPDAPDLCLDDVDSDCDGVTACGAFSPDDAGTTVEGDAYDGWIGEGLTTIGDMDGDGVDDFVVGDWDYNGYRGQARIFGGGTSGTTLWSDPLVTISGAATYDYAGRYMGRVPDVDGDGEDELVLGVPNADQVYSADGAVYLIPASVATGSSAAPSSLDRVTIYGNYSSGNLGDGFVTGIDWDGDGSSEIFAFGSVGSRNYPQAWVLDPPSSGTVAAESYDMFTITNGTATSTGIRNTGCVGDLSGDGIDDIVLNNVISTSTFSFQRSMRVFESTGTSGTTTISGYDAEWTGPAARGGYGFGLGCSADQDFDGDGSLDLLTGDYVYSSVYVFLDPTAGGAYTSADLTVTGGATITDIGTENSFTFVPDMGGDGRAELAFGSTPYGGAGAAGVALGGRTGTVSADDADLLVYGRAAGDYFGVDVRAADLDHDGKGDILVSATGDDVATTDGGAVYVFFGADLLEE